LWEWKAWREIDGKNFGHGFKTVWSKSHAVALYQPSLSYARRANFAAILAFMLLLMVCAII
jgi:hypothetical protein